MARTWDSILHKRVGFRTFEEVWNSRWDRLSSKMMWHILINSVSMDGIWKEEYKVKKEEQQTESKEKEEAIFQEEEEEELKEEERQTESKEEEGEQQTESKEEGEQQTESKEEEQEEEGFIGTSFLKCKPKRERREKIEYFSNSYLCQDGLLKKLYVRLIDPRVQEWILKNVDVWAENDDEPLKSARSRYGSIQATSTPKRLWMGIAAALGFDWTFYTARCIELKLFWCSPACGFDAVGCKKFQSVSLWFNAMLILAGSNENLDRNPSQILGLNPCYQDWLISNMLDRTESSIIRSVVSVLTGLEDFVLSLVSFDLIKTMLLAQFANETKRKIVCVSRFYQLLSQSGPMSLLMEKFHKQFNLHLNTFHDSSSTTWMFLLDNPCWAAPAPAPAPAAAPEPASASVTSTPDSAPAAGPVSPEAPDSPLALEARGACNKCRHTNICTTKVMENWTFWQFVFDELTKLFTSQAISQVIEWAQKFNQQTPVLFEEEAKLDATQRVRVLSNLKTWCVQHVSGPLIHRAVQLTQTPLAGLPPSTPHEKRFAVHPSIRTKVVVCKRWTELARLQLYSPFPNALFNRFWCLDLKSFEANSGFLEGVVIATELKPVLRIWKGALAEVFVQLYETLSFARNRCKFTVRDFEQLFDLLKHHFGNCGEYLWEQNDRAETLLRYQQILAQLRRRLLHTQLTNVLPHLWTKSLKEIRKFKECLITLFCAGLSMRRWRLPQPMNQNPLSVITFWMMKDDVVQLGMRKSMALEKEGKRRSKIAEAEEEGKRCSKIEKEGKRRSKMEEAEEEEEEEGKRRSKIKEVKKEKKEGEKDEEEEKKEEEKVDSKEEAEDSDDDWDPIETWKSLDFETKESVETKKSVQSGDVKIKEPGKRRRRIARAKKSFEMEMSEMEFNGMNWRFPYTKKQCSFSEFDAVDFPENQTCIFLVHLKQLLEDDSVARLFKTLAGKDTWKGEYTSLSTSVAGMLSDVASFDSFSPPEICMRALSKSICTTAFYYLNQVFNDSCFNFDCPLLESL